MYLLFNLRRGLAALILAVGVLSASAAKNEEFDPYTADIELNIKTPEVSAKHHAAVVSAMANLMRTFKGAGYSVEAVRNGEVILVTIPCSKLFAPNSVVLSEKASSQLSPLVPYVKRHDNYKVVVAVHADNTGDTGYSDRITADRASAIDDFFSRETGLGEDSGLIPYGLGSDEPVASNAGIANRAANRRVEIYFIPTKEYIDKAQKRK